MDAFVRELSACSSAEPGCAGMQCCADLDRLCFRRGPDSPRCSSSCARNKQHRADPNGGTRSCATLPSRLRLPSLFCFAAMQSKGSDLALVASQVRSGVGIFACAGYRVFSSEKFELAPGIWTRPLPNFDSVSQAPWALTATWLNVAPFSAAWDIVFKDTEQSSHDWIVKVDPDTVFFPQILSLRLFSLHDIIAALASSQKGVYIQNCLIDGPLQLFGSIEIVSREALQLYAKRGSLCKSSRDFQMGEDMWMQRCLSSLNVAALRNGTFLRDGYCPADKEWQPSRCSFGHAAFHPFKTVDQWWRCHKEASASPTQAPDG